MFSRIAVDPAICLGQPTILGTRITVGVVVKLLASGNTIESILHIYPEIQAEDVRQAAEYAAWVVSDRTIALA